MVRRLFEAQHLLEHSSMVRGGNVIARNDAIEITPE